MRTAWLTIIALLWSAAPAVAEPGTRVRRYGGKIALSDLASMAVFAGGAYLTGLHAANEREGLGPGGAVMLLGAAGYLVVPPLIHGRQGNRRGGELSVAVRVGLPLVGLGAGYLAAGDNQDSGLALGGAIGFGAAMVFDALVLARVEVRRRIGIVPVLSPSPTGPTLGLRGNF